MDRQTLREFIARHAVSEGISETPFEGLRLFRISQPVERLPAIYPPSLCCIVQGRKHTYLKGARYTYDVDHYLCATLSLPVEAEVPFATPEEPVLGLMLDLETRAMAETLIAYETAAGPGGPTSAKELTPGLLLARVDEPLVQVLVRLLELLDKPVALEVLGGSRLRELLFTILEGEASALVRRTFSGAQDIRRVVAYLRAHLSEPLSVDELAQKAGMSRAVFHRRFKAATSFSPLQFIKMLRLSDAAMQMVGGKSVVQVADAVGYASTSQFSREFRRQFGRSPRQWAKAVAAMSPDVHAAGG